VNRYTGARGRADHTTCYEGTRRCARERQGQSWIKSIKDTTLVRPHLTPYRKWLVEVDVAGCGRTVNHFVLLMRKHTSPGSTAAHLDGAAASSSLAETSGRRSPPVVILHAVEVPSGLVSRLPVSEAAFAIRDTGPTSATTVLPEICQSGRVR
jgi:hypothetical protein